MWGTNFRPQDDHARPNHERLSDAANLYIATPKDLAAIWELEVDVRTVIELHEHQWTFLEHAIGLYHRADDEQARQILLDALLAEWEDPDPPEPPVWPCTDYLCINNPDNLTFDHDEPNGWIHLDPNEGQAA